MKRLVAIMAFLGVFISAGNAETSAAHEGVKP